MRLRVDYLKCVRPDQCRRCLQACGRVVLVMYPERREDQKVATGWRLLPLHEGYCNGCRLCVEACPKSAIELLG